MADPFAYLLGAWLPPSPEAPAPRRRPERPSGTRGPAPGHNRSGALPGTFFPACRASIVMNTDAAPVRDGAIRSADSLDPAEIGPLASERGSGPPRSPHAGDPLSAQP